MLSHNVTYSPPTIIDTGATGHLLQCSFPLSNMTAANKDIDVKLPYGSYMTSTNTNFLLIADIPEATTVACIFPI
jgi:hypothetical protein